MKDRKPHEHLPQHGHLWDELHAEAMHVIRCITFLLCMLGVAAMILLLFLTLMQPPGLHGDPACVPASLHVC